MLKKYKIQCYAASITDSVSANLPSGMAYGSVTIGRTWFSGTTSHTGQGEVKIVASIVYIDHGTLVYDELMERSASTNTSVSVSKIIGSTCRTYYMSGIHSVYGRWEDQTFVMNTDWN